MTVKNINPISGKEKQLKNTSIYLLTAVLSNILPVLVLPIFTRILTTEDYGVWALAQVYAAFVNGIANFGLTIGYERNFFEYKETKNVGGLLYSTLLFVVIAFVVFGILTFLFKSQLSLLIINSTAHADILFWSYCATGIAGLKTYYLTYYKNTENAKAFAKYTVYESILAALLSFFMIVFMRIGILGLVWGQLIAGIIIFSFLSFKFLQILPINFNYNALKDSLKLSLPLTPRIFFGVIGNQFDKYMIGLLNTIGGVGIYSIAQRASNILFTFMTAIQNVFSPQVYIRMFEMGDEGKESIGRYLTPFLYISMLLGVLISLFSEEIIFILTPPSYHGAVNIVMIFSMLYGTYFFGKQPQLIYAKKTHITSILTLFSIGLNIIIIIPFIQKWGVQGAAWGSFVAGIISGTIYFIVSQKYYNIKWEYEKISAIFSVFFGSTIILILLREYGVSYELRIIVKFIFLAIYLYLGIKYNILSKENYLLVKKMIVSARASFSRSH